MAAQGTQEGQEAQECRQNRVPEREQAGARGAKRHTTRACGRAVSKVERRTPAAMHMTRCSRLTSAPIPFNIAGTFCGLAAMIMMSLFCTTCKFSRAPKSLRTWPLQVARAAPPNKRNFRVQFPGTVAAGTEADFVPSGGDV